MYFCVIAHFTTYHYSPTFYSPFPDYHPIVPLALWSLSHQNHHNGYGNSYHYHNTYNNYNKGNGASGNNGNSAINQNLNNGQNNVTDISRQPFQSTAPLVYSISAQNKSSDDDSTEIIFSNACLIVGVDNLLLYAELHDNEDIMIIIEQDSDGLEPYSWDLQPIAANATSANETAAAVNTTVTPAVPRDLNGGTIAANLDTTTTVPLSNQ